MTITDGNLNDEDSWKLYDFETRWNDSNIGIPLLFNFYHGMELIMKGILSEEGVAFPKVHSLDDLVSELKENVIEIPLGIFQIFKKYTSNKSPFNYLFEKNQIKPNVTTQQAS